MLKKSLFVAFSSALAQAIVAVLYIVLARSAGPSSLGDVVAVVAAATYLAGMINFGTDNLWIRGISSGAIDTPTLYTNMVSKLVYSLLATLSLTFITASIWPDSAYYMVGLISFSIIFYQTFTVPLRARGETAKYSFVTVSERALTGAVFAFLLLIDLSPETAFLTALIVGSTSAGIVAHLLVAPANRWLLQVHGLRWPWRGSLSYGIGGMALSAQVLDSTILYAVAGPSATGIYGAVNRWTQPMSVLASAFATTGLPVVARHNSLKASFSELKGSWWLLGVAACGCLLVAALSPHIVTILLGEQYADSATILAILALGTIPALVNQPLYVFMQAMGLARLAAFGVIFSVALQLTLCFILSHKYAATGAAVSMAIAQSCLLATFLLALFKGPLFARNGRKPKGA